MLFVNSSSEAEAATDTRILLSSGLMKKNNNFVGLEEIEISIKRLNI